MAVTSNSCEQKNACGRRETFKTYGGIYCGCLVGRICHPGRGCSIPSDLHWLLRMLYHVQQGRHDSLDGFILHHDHPHHFSKGTINKTLWLTARGELKVPQHVHKVHKLHSKRNVVAFHATTALPTWPSQTPVICVLSLSRLTSWSWYQGTVITNRHWSCARSLDSPPKESRYDWNQP